MSARIRRVPSRAPWESEPVSPAATVPIRGALERQLEELKAQLLEAVWRETPHPELREPLRHAANEAAALAWMTPYPLLVLPELVAEKARLARLRAQRQREIYWRSPVFATPAIRAAA